MALKKEKITMSFYGEFNKVIDLQYLVSKGFSFPLLIKVYHIIDKLSTTLLE